MGAQVQSYVSRVRFVEACAAIPADALLLEVGPHALLRSPLRQNRATLPCASAACWECGDDVKASTAACS